LAAVTRIITQDKAEINQLIGLWGKVVAVAGNLFMLRINLQEDADSNGVFVVVEKYYRRLYVSGIGLTFGNAIYDAIRRAAQFDDMEGIEKIKALERARYQNEDNE